MHRWDSRDFTPAECGRGTVVGVKYLFFSDGVAMSAESFKVPAVAAVPVACGCGLWRCADAFIKDTYANTHRSPIRIRSIHRPSPEGVRECGPKLTARPTYL